MSNNLLLQQLLRLIEQEWNADDLSRLFDVTKTMEREFPYIEIVPDEEETSENTNITGNVDTRIGCIIFHAH